MSDAEARLDRVRDAWDERRENPLQAADLLAERYQSEEVSPYQLSLEVGARAAEVSVYLDLAELEPAVRETIVDEGFPLSLATDLVKEGPEQQQALLELLLEGSQGSEDVLAFFEKIAKDYYEDRGVNASTVSGPALMHMGRKAKEYNALSKRRRGALVSIGKVKMTKGYSSLSTAQIRYVNDILQELEDEGILQASCSDGECEHCEAVAQLVEDTD